MVQYWFSTSKLSLKNRKAASFFYSAKPAAPKNVQTYLRDFLLWKHISPEVAFQRFEKLVVRWIFVKYEWNAWMQNLHEQQKAPTTLIERFRAEWSAGAVHCISRWQFSPVVIHTNCVRCRRSEISTSVAVKLENVQTRCVVILNRLFFFQRSANTV